MNTLLHVIPAKAGIQTELETAPPFAQTAWAPAFAGVTTRA